MSLNFIKANAHCLVYLLYQLEGIPLYKRCLLTHYGGVFPYTNIITVNILCMSPCKHE